jgi:hypothetical protein
MGSLIFLLLATTKRMRDIALAEAETERRGAERPLASSGGEPRVMTALEAPHVAVDTSGIPVPQPALGDAAPSLVDLPSPAEPDPEVAREQERLEQEWRDKLAALEARREQLLEALRQQQRLQQAAKASIADLEDSAGEAETRLRGVLAQIEAQDAAPDEVADAAALENEIIELRKKLRLLQNRPTEGKTKYAVIPFDVRSGTTRRPILIECTDTGLRFVSEDIVITPADLEGFTDKYNPLLAGAGALVKYWLVRNQQQENPDQEPEPYVLLIVRPSGTVAYYVAMKMLSSMKQPFGYELVDETLQLQPLPADPLAKEACQQAIAKLLAERSEIMEHARGGFRGGARSGARKRSKTTFEVADVLSPTDEVGERSWENIDRFEGRKGKPTTAAPPTAPKAAPAKHGNGQIAGDAAPKPKPPSSTKRAPPAESFPEDEPAHARGSRAARRLQERTQSQRPFEGGAANSEVHLEQLARRRWGASEPGATIGVEQDVTVRIDAHQMLVADERVVRYDAGEQPMQVFLRLMEAVDAEAQSWGKPRPGFYWTPRLRFVISPGGNQMFERLDPLATRSGLAATREFTLDGIRPVAEEVVP